MRFEHKKFIYHTFGIFNATLVALGTTVYANSHMDTELTVNYIILSIIAILAICFVGWYALFAYREMRKEIVEDAAEVSGQTLLPDHGFRDGDIPSDGQQPGTAEDITAGDSSDSGDVFTNV